MLKSAEVLTSGWEITGDQKLPIIVDETLRAPNDEQVVTLQSGSKKPCEISGWFSRLFLPVVWFIVISFRFSGAVHVRANNVGGS
jgi:hypothetical protein